MDHRSDRRHPAEPVEVSPWRYSGGSTPKKLHLLLAASPYKEKIDWKKLHIFWGDERDVPFEDERNNAKNGFRYIIESCGCYPQTRFTSCATDLPADQSAIAYETILHQYFGEALPAKSFDLVLLGMGDDGHTLSLFPRHAGDTMKKKPGLLPFISRRRTCRASPSQKISLTARAR